MKKSVLLLMVASFVYGAGAATLRYKGSGDWFNDIVTDGTGWFDQAIGQGTAVVPGSSDVVRFNWGNNTVTLSDVVTVNQFQMGVDESGGLVVENGGSLTASGNSKVGNNNVCTGFLTINAGGTVNANGGWLMVAGNSSVTGIVEVSGILNSAGHLWMATGTGATASLTINDGGVVSVDGMIGLGTSNASTASGGNATVTINDGGLLVLANIHGAGTSVFPGSMFNLNGNGRITLSGDFTGVMNDLYIPTYVTGNGVLGNAFAAYDEAADITTVTAVPEPVTLSLLGLGAIVLMKKKRA